MDKINRAEGERGQGWGLLPVGDRANIKLSRPAHMPKNPHAPLPAPRTVLRWPAPCCSYRFAGEASAILARAEATAKGVHLLAKAIGQANGSEAVSLRVAEQYLEAFSGIAKASTTVLLPATAHDPASMVAQAMGIYGSLSGRLGLPSSGGNGGVAGEVPGQLASSSAPLPPASPEETPTMPRKESSTSASDKQPAPPKFSLRAPSPFG
jgi:hypothetical protein